MSDGGVKARAREALTQYREASWTGPTDDEGWDYVESLLAALDAAESSDDDMVRHVADQRNEAMAERDAARAVIRQAWEMMRAYYDGRIDIAEAVRAVDGALGGGI